MSDSMQLDTVIIGGGITGLYASYQLYKQKGPRHRIASSKNLSDLVDASRPSRWMGSWQNLVPYALRKKL